MDRLNREAGLPAPGENRARIRTQRMKVRTRIALGIFVLLTGVLAWGYWHVSTHAFLNIQINDYGLSTENQLYGSPHHATLELFDSSQSPLAVAKTVEPYGYVTALHPTLGDCTSVQGKGGGEYSACYSKYSYWASGWAGRSQFATLKVGDCIIRNVPVHVMNSKTGWALWWVPLPHVGGIPFEYIELKIQVDSRSCASVDKT
jgi:hypothetical protein